MTELEKALAFNREIKNALELIYSELNQGQQKKLLKNAEIEALMKRYGVVQNV